METESTSKDLVGAYLAHTVLDPSGRRVLLRAGTRLTPRILGLLRRHGIERIEISHTPLAVVGGSIDASLRDEAASAASDFTQCALAGVDCGDTAARVARSTEQLVSEVQQLRRVRYNLRHLRAWDEYTFHHSIQVAELSVVIGQELGLTDDELTRLAIGASLHDIGKAAIPLQILHKPAPLTAPEYEIIKTHPRAGWEMVRRTADFWHTSTIVLLQHHERLDGSGYPQGLGADDIYFFSRIVAVADCFDAMRADRGYRGPVPGGKVLAYLMANAGVRLDEEAVAGLLARCNLFPDGETIRLTDGTLAEVVAQNPEDLLHPLVRLLDAPRQEGAPELLDLAASGLEIDVIVDEGPPLPED